MAKLNRESRLREKRADKEARKAERRLAAAQEAEGPLGDDLALEDDGDAETSGESAAEQAG
jgi:hypothetical protein